MKLKRMAMLRWIVLVAIVSLVAVSVPFALGQNASPVTADGAPDKEHPARLVPLELESHGAAIFGVFYAAAGKGPHPTVLLLHGFPGYEGNVDLAQAMRRAGWNVFTFHYRGAWGSHGDFSFTHAAEDTTAMLEYLRDAGNAARLGVDPARIVLMGHSMGGFMAAYATQGDGKAEAKGAAKGNTKLAGLVVISAWNIGAEAARTSASRESDVIARYRSNTGPLTGCTAESLWGEARRHGAQWDLVKFAPRLSALPVLVIDADDRNLGDARAFAAALKEAGNRNAREVHFATDHSYSDQRIALETAVVEWLGEVRKRE